MGRNYE
jgi:hypothetical protein